MIISTIGIMMNALLFWKEPPCLGCAGCVCGGGMAGVGGTGLGMLCSGRAPGATNDSSMGCFSWMDLKTLWTGPKNKVINPTRTPIEHTF